MSDRGNDKKPVITLEMLAEWKSVPVASNKKIHRRTKSQQRKNGRKLKGPRAPRIRNEDTAPDRRRVNYYLVYLQYRNAPVCKLCKKPIYRVCVGNSNGQILIPGVPDLKKMTKVVQHVFWLIWVFHKQIGLPRGVVHIILRHRFESLLQKNQKFEYPCGCRYHATCLEKSSLFRCAAHSTVL